MKKPEEQNKTKINAMTISIALHVVILAVLAFVQFSKALPSGSKDAKPQATISQVQKKINSEPIVPKPKIKERVSDLRKNRKRLLARKSKPKQNSAESIATLMPQESDITSLFQGSSDENIEFFGNSTNMRKVCFVVDCSGSMLGLFREVRGQLCSSLSMLKPDNFFSVIIFKGDTIIETGEGRLCRATAAAVNEAAEIVRTSPRPFGKPDAAKALKKAFKLRDSSGNAPDVVYFLTDGFDFSTSENVCFIDTIEKMRKQFAPSAKIHTIGFWTNKVDREMLNKIAARSGGHFVYYSGKDG